MQKEETYNGSKSIGDCVGSLTPCRSSQCHRYRWRQRRLHVIDGNLHYNTMEIWATKPMKRNQNRGDYLRLNIWYELPKPDLTQESTTSYEEVIIERPLGQGSCALKSVWVLLKICHMHSSLRKRDPSSLWVIEYSKNVCQASDPKCKPDLAQGKSSSLL